MERRAYYTWAWMVIGTLETGIPIDGPRTPSEMIESRPEPMPESRKRYKQVYTFVVT